MKEKTKNVAKKVMNKVACSDASDPVTFLGFYKPKRPSALHQHDRKVNQ